MVATLVATVVCSCSAKTDSASQRSQPAAPATLVSEVDRLFASVRGRGPGYAIGVIRRGQLIVARGYGRASLERGQPITADTAFNIASLSKQFTGAAVVLELLKGGVRLDDPLARHWTSLPPFMKPITVGHLVYMTSGLPEYYSLPSPKGGWV